MIAKLLRSFLVCALLVAAPAHALEVVAGTPASSINAFSCNWPAHQADDVGLLAIESTESNHTLDTANGFSAVASGSVAAGGATSLTLYMARATSGAMSAPVITDPTNHGYCVIIRIRGLNAATALADLVDAIASSNKTVASTSASAPSITTSSNGSVVFNIIARDDDLAGAGFSGWANADLTGGSPLSDDGTTSSNGGGIGIYYGLRVTAGSVGVTTATVNNSANASITLALEVPPAGPTNPLLRRRRS